MKKQNIPLVALLILIGFSSCKTIMVQDTKSRDNTTQALPSATVINKPLIAETHVDLSKKISGKANGPIEGVYTEAYYREQALADAIVNNNCDVVYNPIYTVVVTHNRMKGKLVATADITVTGYAATFKSIRNFEDKDTTLVKTTLEIEQQTPVNQSTPSAPLLPIISKKYVSGKIY